MLLDCFECPMEGICEELCNYENNIHEILLSIINNMKGEVKDEY